MTTKRQRRCANLVDGKLRPKWWSDWVTGSPLTTQQRRRRAVAKSARAARKRNRRS